jgi:hypothetical protein
MDNSCSSPDISNQKLYAMVLKLTDRCVQLETNLANLAATGVSGSPPVPIETVETYFGKKPNPIYRFNMINTIIEVIDDDITNLFDATARETLSNLLRRNMYVWMSSGNCPIHVFRKKLYVYDYDYDKIDEDTITRHFPKWRVYNLAELTYLLNHIQKIILSKLMEWKVKQDSIRISADVCDLMYQKALQKILKIDFKLSTTINTIKAMISKICTEWTDYE